jgi:hypothetical protein
VNSAVLIDTLTSNAFTLDTGKIRYTRRDGAPGDASVVVPKTYLQDVVCADPAGLAEAYGYQLEITRVVPGKRPEVTFVGPVTGWSEVAGATTIVADDVLGWFRCPHARTRSMFNDDASIVTRTVLLDSVSTRREFIDAWMDWDVEASSVGATVIIDGTKRRPVFDVLRDILASSTDLCAVGKRVVIRGKRNQVVTFVLEDQHFLNELRTWEDGRQFADIVYVQGAGSVAGQYPLPGVPYQPRSPIPVEVSVDRADLRSIAECNRAAFSEWTERSGLAVQVDVPSAGRMSPETPVALSSLIPGTLGMIRLANRHHPLVATMRLGSVTVTQGSADGAPRAADGTFVPAGNAADEQVSITLTPQNVEIVE